MTLRRKVFLEIYKGKNIYFSSLASLRLHAFALKNHLSFKVERLKSAKRIATMTNRKTIFGSFQPPI